MNVRATLWAVLLLTLSVQGCKTKRAAVPHDPTTGLTLSGPRNSLDAFLRSAEDVPHKWTVERRWFKDNGSAAVRLRWPNRPAPSDVGGIVALVQAAQANGLTISDTQIVQTQP